MEAEFAHKGPKCMWGDGCLLRLSDQHHDDSYIHTTSPIVKCALNPCHLYQKAYDFVVGPTTELTKEIKEAQLHSALHYHPPIRSKSVFRERPSPNSRRSSDQKATKTVPKLDLDTLSSPQTKSSTSPQVIKSAPVAGSTFSHVKPKSSSVPARSISPIKAILISPKKRSSSVSGSKIDLISKEIDEMKAFTTQNNSEIRSLIGGIQKDIAFIKEMLLKEKEGKTNDF